MKYRQNTPTVESDYSANAATKSGAVLDSSGDALLLHNYLESECGYFVTYCCYG